MSASSRPNLGYTIYTSPANFGVGIVDKETIYLTDLPTVLGSTVEIEQILAIHDFRSDGKYLMYENGRHTFSVEADGTHGFVIKVSGADFRTGEIQSHLRVELVGKHPGYDESTDTLVTTSGGVAPSASTIAISGVVNGSSDSAGTEYYYISLEKVRDNLSVGLSAKSNCSMSLLMSYDTAEDPSTIAADGWFDLGLGTVSAGDAHPFSIDRTVQGLGRWVAVKIDKTAAPATWTIAYEGR